MTNPLTDISDFILHGLLYNEDFSRQSIQSIEVDHFEYPEQRRIFSHIKKFRNEYGSSPTPSAILVSISQENISENELGSVESKVEDLKAFEDSKEHLTTDWLLKEAETWCKNRAFYNAILECAEAVESKKEISTMGLPEKMSKALAFSFDHHIGMDFLEEAQRRYEFYHNVEAKIPFSLQMFNKITKGGVVKKSLTCFMSNNTGGFKSGTMSDWASFLMREGYNVLYITCEMSEEKIGHRIDANCMNMELDYIEEMPKPLYFEKSEMIRKKSSGRLIIKEYPTSSAHAGHFRFLIKELKARQNFVPDVVFFDYINICASSRLKAGESNSYFYIKAIAEELRGLAIENNFAAITATQGNRGAINSTDVSMGDIAESYGLPQTCDLLMAIITTEELDEMKRIRFKQLKNRYGDPSRHRVFDVGINKAKMQLFDIEGTSSFVGENNTKTEKPTSDYSGWKFD